MEQELFFTRVELGSEIVTTPTLSKFEVTHLRLVAIGQGNVLTHIADVNLMSDKILYDDTRSPNRAFSVVVCEPELFDTHHEELEAYVQFLLDTYYPASPVIKLPAGQMSY
ncbi:hypothetical protein PMO31116_00510 [Pandoraea morbifera]|uniref:Uncharacterized protein n=1 Tax=Pandoraea morbifera TaxID=2508300 RepID=A0A5E4S579_9BURK|nr:hypothetical protein [Pandoraea morbifera]VVD69199.1 hypothetical protein PMO31116_00510 [Pandoraea morbifera]